MFQEFCKSHLYQDLLHIKSTILDLIKICTSPVHKLLGNVLGTLGFLGNFQLVEQLSVHRAASTYLCFISHSHALAISETITKCRI